MSQPFPASPRLGLTGSRSPQSLPVFPYLSWGGGCSFPPSLSGVLQVSSPIKDLFCNRSAVLLLRLLLILLIVARALDHLKSITDGLCVGSRLYLPQPLCIGPILCAPCGVLECSANLLGTFFAFGLCFLSVTILDSRSMIALTAQCRPRLLNVREQTLVATSPVKS